MFITTEKAIASQEIYQRLSETQYASMNTNRTSGIGTDARFMSFACDPDLRHVYFLSQPDTLKTIQVRQNPRVSVSILSPAERIEDYCETVITGRVNVYSDFLEHPVQLGLNELGKKYNLVKMIQDTGSLNGYFLLDLETEEVVFQTYLGSLKRRPKTIYQF